MEQDKPRERPPRPLPARRSQQRLHRLVLGDAYGRGACVGHHCGRRGERIGQVDTGAGTARCRARSRKRGRIRQRRGRGMTVERGAEQHHRVRACDVATAARGARRFREGGLHPLERAGERNRPFAFGAVDAVAREVGLDFGFGGGNRVAEHEQVAQTFALPLPKIGQPRLGLQHRRDKRLHCPRLGVGEGSRQALDALGRVNRAGAAAQALAHEGLGARSEICAELGEDGFRQSADGDD